jgi:hypothetical protein
MLKLRKHHPKTARPAHKRIRLVSLHRVCNSFPKPALAFILSSILLSAFSKD